MIAGPLTLLPCRAVRDVVLAVLNLRADYGLLPVETMIEGPVQDALAALDTLDLERLAEQRLPVRLALLGLADSSASQIREVLGQAMALRQCARWLAGHPKVRTVEAPDTAGAARMVALRRDRHAAAIAASWAAAHYGLVVLEEDLQDRDDNTTRFILVRRRAERALTDATDDPGT
jgi:prephenate dehydratase